MRACVVQPVASNASAWEGAFGERCVGCAGVGVGFRAEGCGVHCGAAKDRGTDSVDGAQRVVVLRTCCGYGCGCGVVGGVGGFV